MKIAHLVSLQENVPPKSKNGLEFVVAWLVDELVARGHDVTLLAPAESKTKAKLISIKKNNTLEKNVNNWGSHNFSLWNTSLVASINTKFDIIHSHTETITSYMPFISKPTILTVHGQYNDSFREKYLSKKKYLKYFDFALAQYKKINYVTISKKQEQNFLKCQKYYFKKHTTIYNGIPMEKFGFNDQPHNYLFFIGYINKDKGADVAVRMAKKLKMKLILAGEISSQEKFFNTAIKPYLNKDIKYIGPVNFKEKNILYKNALATLAPISWEEPFGLTLAESQACGTPVIAFNRGAAPEIIQNGKTGFLVNTENEMIKSIKKINTINRLDCRQRVEEKFSVKRMVDDYEKLYKKLANK